MALRRARQRLFVLLVGIVVALPSLAVERPRCRCVPEGCTVPYIACRKAVDTRTARELLAYTRTVLRAAFPGRFELPPTLDVVAVPSWELKRVGGEPVLGYWDEQRILVSEDLYRGQGLAVVAHEYGHYWHFQHHPEPDAMSEPMVEGFAEWVAFQTLKRAGHLDECDRIRTNTDPVYGHGFRWFRNVEREHGADAVFDIALTWIDFQGHRVATGNKP
ncbi:MAG: hypothetical protein HY319_22750 [Armatimonadetes bacterium]|nr:hypothetical protein [Armatimonadota bacterium]